MAAPDPNAPPTGGNRYPEDEAKDLIEKCIQLYMNREETAYVLETEMGIEGWLTHLVWNKLVEDNPEFFQNYYTRLALKRQIIGFDELLKQQHPALNFLWMPVEQQISTELTETAPQADSPVAGSDPNLVPGSSLVHSSLEGQGTRTNADAAHMPISQVPNLIPGGHHTASFTGPFQPSSSRARSLSRLGSNPEGSNQKNHAN